MDTSGFVEGPPAGVRTKRIYWSDLDDVPQGYIVALFAEMARGYDRTVKFPLGFSDLAPETLAAILKDCGAFVKGHPGWDFKDGGTLFWRTRQHERGERQADNIRAAFPPLTPTIRDDGKVYLTAQGASK